MTERRKLILFTSGDPKETPRHAWSAYHWGLNAASAGLEAEVRLAGDAVRILHDDGIPETEKGVQLRGMMQKALDADLMVSG
jgi:hypothetical protein